MTCRRQGTSSVLAPSRGDAINSNDVLIAVRYPDKATGLASSAEQELFSSSAIGQSLTKTDRNGNVHTYSYDVLGRVTADSVTTLGTGVDGAIRRIGTTYNTQGLPDTITSFNAATGGNVVNQVQRDRQCVEPRLRRRRTGSQMGR